MDVINALFEFCGALAIIPSIRAALREKQIMGLSIWSTVFFAAWGWWNLIYYPHLNQSWSAWTALLLAITNTIYLFLIWKYKYSDAWRCKRCMSGGES